MAEGAAGEDRQGPRGDRGPWNKKKYRVGGAGRIDCPACGGHETLGFTRAAYNGHIHAACKTDGCVSWME